MVQDIQTPLMKQYFAVKSQYPDALILFQVGDFYEVFFDDAKTVSSFLAIALTKRGKNNGEDIPLCGVPVHALQHYLTKLVRGGFKVALCDQMTKPQPGKVVERAVTQVFTPGTLTDASMLDDKSASYLLSFFPGREQWGMIFTELLTAQMFATTVPAEDYRMIDAELVRFFPDEILIPDDVRLEPFGTYFRKQGYVVSPVKPGIDVVGPDIPSAWIEKQFSGAIAMRLAASESMTNSLNLLYWYLKKNQERALEQCKSIQFYQPDDYLVLDAATQKNLEIVANAQDGGRKYTLFSALDKAVTPMGSRTIKKWLLRPLISHQGIMQRQEVVVHLAADVVAMQRLQDLFAQCADLERIVGRVALGRAALPDYLALKNSLSIIPEIKELLRAQTGAVLAATLHEKLVEFAALIQLLETSLEDEAGSPWLIKQGFDLELDRLRGLVENSQQAVLQLEQQEITRTGIASLKIRYNNISGYYIEVTKPNLDQVPADYQHQQTLVNRTRFVTPALKELERDILRAQNEIETVQQEVFGRIKKTVEEQLSALRSVAQALSYLDALLGFARAAYDNAYIAPTLTQDRDVIIEGGRHPVVEAASSNKFIPNDTNLTEQERVWILTGPNMGGKSTYLRQVALISLMAQVGSLVPAKAARLPILDRIFTRIGSGDNLAQGKSTFLVEMEETAAICTQATKNSLVILDEVGRGTSTFDGMALAQAIVEFVTQRIGARCLFATHYHELTHLKNHIAGIANYHMASKRVASGVLFLYQLTPGASEGSFGLEVAKLARLPESIIVRAAEILKTLERQEVATEEGLFYGDEISARWPTGQSFDTLRTNGHKKTSQAFVDGECIVPSGKDGDNQLPFALSVSKGRSEAETEACGIKTSVSPVRHSLGDGGKDQHECADANCLEIDPRTTQILAELGTVDLNNLSPKQAFDLIWKFKEILEK